MVWNSNEFIDWFNESEDNELLEKAVLSYYSDSPNLYRVEVNGTVREIPILTKDDWIDSTSCLSSVVGEYDTEMCSDYDRSVVESHVESVARKNGDENPDVQDYVFNGECVRPVRVDSSPIQIDGQRTDFFTQLTTNRRLYQEIWEMLWEAGVSADSSRGEIESVTSDATLPVRRQYGYNMQTALDTLPDRSAPIGVNALTVFNTGRGWEVLLGKRAEDLVFKPGLWHITPAGAVVERDGTMDFERDVFQEYSEEVFGVEEDMWDDPAMRQLDYHLTGGDAHLDFTGLGVTAERLGLFLACLLVVDSPDYYDRFVRDQDLTTPEVDEYELIPIDDTDRLESLVFSDNFVGTGKFAVIEGLRHLQAEYGVSAEATELDYSVHTPN